MFFVIKNKTAQPGVPFGIVIRKRDAPLMTCYYFFRFTSFILITFVLCSTTILVASKMDIGHTSLSRSAKCDDD